MSLTTSFLKTTEKEHLLPDILLNLKWLMRTSEFGKDFFFYAIQKEFQDQRTAVLPVNMCSYFLQLK